jgi:hypothetical protein
MLAMAYAMLPGKILIRNKNYNPFKGIDIEKEYQFIKDKKSELSRIQRDRVVYAYEHKRKES